MRTPSRVSEATWIMYTCLCLPVRSTFIWRYFCQINLQPPSGKNRENNRYIFNITRISWCEKHFIPFHYVLNLKQHISLCIMLKFEDTVIYMKIIVMSKIFCRKTRDFVLFSLCVPSKRYQTISFHYCGVHKD